MVVDDEVNLCRSLRKALQREGLEIDAFSNPGEAIAALGSNTYAVALIDLMMPQISGLDLLREVRRVSPGTVVVLMTAYATIQTAVDAMRLGAFDYVQKPFTNEEVRQYIDRALAQYASTQDGSMLGVDPDAAQVRSGIIGSSAAIQEVLRIVGRVAKSHATVLITGESGTGKELIARALHTESERRDEPFVAINCGAIPSELPESELFGYEKGAFTGATAAKRGLVEQAHGGSLFLDEVTEMLPHLQVKLLRMLQEREIQRVGGEGTIGVDVRVIAASNADLSERMQAGQFRTDLYYRLNVVSLRLPALRERPDDVLPLAQHFLRKHDHGGRLKRIAPAAAQLLRNYRWPGNVRELENIIERASLLARGEEIAVADLPAEFSHSHEVEAAEETPGERSLSVARDEFEREFLIECLRRNRGNVSRAAREAGLQRQNFYSKLNKYGIQRKDYMT